MSPEPEYPISVVMPVHNALPYLDEAVQSILGQTLADFEFVIYDDASTDGSHERLEHWATRDHRIRLIRGDRNLGPAGSSNAVVRHSTAPLVARMDADDISHPDRLERQSRVMAERPDAGIVATLCTVIDSEGQLVRGPDLWRLHAVSWFKPFAHGSMMVRRSLFDAIGGYRDECEYWEDLDFVLRASEEARILVLPAALYAHRQTGSCTRLASAQQRVENAMDLRYQSLARLAKGEKYDDLLRCISRDWGPVDPRVFVSLGSLSIAARERPRLVRRFLSRARIRLDAATAISAIWVMWATVSPSSLRAAMDLISGLRNRRSRLQEESEGEPVEWLTPASRRRA